MNRRLVNIAAWLAVALLLLFGGRAAHAQDAWKQIRARGELIISTDATYPPFEYKDDKGTLVGFDVDLGNEIGKRLGVKVTWLPLEWTAVLGSLEAHKADLIMSGMTITDERKQKGYTFSRPYFLSGQTIARRADDNRINGLLDLKTRIVSVQDETTGMYAVQKIGVPNNHIMKFDQLQDALLDVRNHKSDAAVADVPALKRLQRMGYPDMKLVGGVIKEEYLGVAARRNEKELITAINQALDAILADGRYTEIYKQWIQEPVTTHILGRLDSVRNEGSVPIDDNAPSLLPGAPGAPSANETKGAAAEAAPPPTHPGLVIRGDILRGALPLLLQGAQTTITVTLFTLLFGIAGGLLVALLRLSPLAPLRAVMVFYVEIVRGTPLLMQLYTIYFVLPAIGISFQSPMVAGIIALSLNAAAYISEIFRAGIESIDSGQMEAARALGLDYAGAMRWIILPQTLRRVLPPLTNEAVALLKDSSLVSVIAVTELMRVGKEEAANTAAPTTIFLAVALIYLVMTLPLTWLVRQLETRWQPISTPREQRTRRRKGVAA
ncbi:MAG TPA: ABC transporter permease subunit [Chthonomonadaceae bacterium]|nr:ABC transporter permease subunit [Chthonomonadaceae bacterium]